LHDDEAGPQTIGDDGSPKLMIPDVRILFGGTKVQGVTAPG
jgi:hypothetical protein